jgi:rod shape determining protein RodA
MAKTIWRYFDVPLFLAVIVTAGFGLVMVYSATITDKTLGNLAPDQFWKGVVPGIILFILFSRLDYHIFQSLQFPIYIFCVLSLIAVRSPLGSKVLGATRWIQLGPIQWQPSETVKLLMILLLARFYVTNEHRVRRLPVFIFSLAMTVPIVVLVLIQPDLGTAMVLMAVWVVMTWTAGCDRLHLLTLAFGIVLAIFLVWQANDFTGGKVDPVPAYMRARVDSWLHPEHDPRGEGYNLIQSRLAVEGGGLTGQGLTQGFQNRASYLKIRDADFIFSVIAEEFGFVGCVALFSILTLILLRIIHAAGISLDSYGRNICIGVFTMLFFQIFVNVGMNLGLMPVTGIPLPLISKGASSFWTTMMGLGLVQSVVMRHRRDVTWYYRTGPAPE